VRCYSSCGCVDEGRQRSLCPLCGRMEVKFEGSGDGTSDGRVIWLGSGAKGGVSEIVEDEGKSGA
jgi:hypothetical protein